MDTSLPPIITVEELLHIKSRENLVIIDASNAKEAYADFKRAHLDKAVFVDVHTQLASVQQDVSHGGRHPLPSIATFITVLDHLGIYKDAHIVVYDHAAGANAAARFWWMLKALGHQKIQVLSGGFEYAKSKGFPISEGESASLRGTDYTLDRNWTLPTVDIHEVERASADDGYTIIDVREESRYHGIHEPIDLVAGHIPSAINLPFSLNLDENGLFLDAKHLRDVYRTALEGRDLGKTIVHCGSGVTACHTILAMHLAGLSIPKLYVGSWSEWSRNNKPIDGKRSLDLL